MRSLNTYNYREEVGFNAINYMVSISDDDKIIRIEEDGSLIAELAFALSNNILYLNGKDGLEVSQIELPIAMQEIKSQTYDSENKAIDLEILQTDGSSVIFSLDVAELVNVYTAGDGIEISADNIISIKIKDDENNILSVSEEGLDIALDSLASASSLEDLKCKVSTLSGQTEELTNQVITLSNSIIDGFNSISSNLSEGFARLDRQDAKETEERKAADDDLSSRIDGINDVLGTLEDSNSSVAEEIKELQETDKEIMSKLGDLDIVDNTVAEKLVQLENAIADEALVRKTTDDEILSKIGQLEDSETSVAEEIENLKKVDEDLYFKINSLDNTGLVASLSELKSAIEEEAKTRGEKDVELFTLLNKETDDRKLADDELKELIDENYEALSNIKLVEDKENNLRYILYVNDVVKGEINIPNDKMLESVVYDSENKKLIFSWNTDIEQDPTIVDVSDLVDEYVGTNGISISSLGNGTKSISIPLDKSKYIKLNDKGQIEWACGIIKDKSKPWVYYFNDKESNNNGKIIDFTEDVNNLLKSIQGTYAPISYVDEKDDLVKSELIGKPEDTSDVNTLYGIRAAINESGNLDGSRIEKAKQEAIAAAAEDATAKDNALRDELKAYHDTSIQNVNNYITEVESGLNQKYSDLGEAVAKNSTDIKQLSTGLGSSEYTGGTGLFDELHRLFHELIEGMDENYLKGSVQRLIEKVDTLQKTMNILIGDVDTAGSIANSVADAIRQANEYTDSKFAECKEDAASKYQPIGEYVTKEELDSKDYIDGSELDKLNYVTESELNSTVSVFITKSDAATTYQPKGNYLTEVPSEYVTETELLKADYASKEYVDRKDEKLLSKDMADALYQSKNDGYVTMAELNAMDFATELYVDNKTSHLLSASDAALTYQPKGNYLTEIPSEYITESELEANHFVSKTDLEGKNYATKEELTVATADMLTNSVAKNTYQPIGEYVTSSQLEARKYATEEYVNHETEDMATQTWVMVHFASKDNTFVTKEELDARKYITEVDLIAKGYVDEVKLENALHEYVTIENAETTYTPVTEFNELKENVVTVQQIEAGDNIKVEKTENNQVKVSVKLSDKYNVEDKYSQDLPISGNNLDELTEKLSKALKNLYDTTDGELINF